jgi:hypothetical protein
MSSLLSRFISRDNFCRLFLLLDACFHPIYASTNCVSISSLVLKMYMYMTSLDTSQYFQSINAYLACACVLGDSYT